MRMLLEEQDQFFAWHCNSCFGLETRLNQRPPRLLRLSQGREERKEVMIGVEITQARAEPVKERGKSAHCRNGPFLRFLPDGTLPAEAQNIQRKLDR